MLPENELFLEQPTMIVTSSVANGFQLVIRMSYVPGLSSKMKPQALTDGLPVWEYE